ncbi:MAG: hypothetical protein H0A76_12295 [Candidatus Thiodubiliella endoseptemdiera]|uniref:Uncharacterized protein n=1 Tax=Candidatus Thiodubiliella endoseptemdiera TaxID=2738886 RepID=A0A853F7R6_9GAMM|nr:hypothetical protein [Candidatus Thiodubiliella endoseptemdiera]
MITELKAKEKELGLTKSDYEAIGLYAIKKQKGGIARLVNMGYTTEFLVNHELSVDQLAMYTFMSENLESLSLKPKRITQ